MTGTTETAANAETSALNLSDINTRLTPREREVALKLAHGDKNSDIAEALDISIKTVDTHRGHILKKLKLRNNVDLARLAIRDGLLAP